MLQCKITTSYNRLPGLISQPLITRVQSYY
jgi:hypothetical protein